MHDRLNSERVRIMKMVDAQIAKMGPQMQVGTRKQLSENSCQN